MMDGVHHMMDRVHHMLNRVHPLIEFGKNIGDTLTFSTGCKKNAVSCNKVISHKVVSRVMCYGCIYNIIQI